MNITGTRAAFAKIIREPNVHAKLGVSRVMVTKWRKYVIEEKYVTLNKMEEMLLKYGATVKQEKIWEII